jgi:hypothetical protein
MGIGPTYAIPPLLSGAGITKDDVDLFEASTILILGVGHFLTCLGRIDKRGVRIDARVLRA